MISSDQMVFLAIGIGLGIIVGIGIPLLRRYFRQHDAEVERRYREEEWGEDEEE